MSAPMSFYRGPDPDNSGSTSPSPSPSTLNRVRLHHHPRCHRHVTTIPDGRIQPGIVSTRTTQPLNQLQVPSITISGVIPEPRPHYLEPRPASSSTMPGGFPGASSLDNDDQDKDGDDDDGQKHDDDSTSQDIREDYGRLASRLRNIRVAFAVTQKELARKQTIIDDLNLYHRANLEVKKRAQAARDELRLYTEKLADGQEKELTEEAMGFGARNVAEAKQMVAAKKARLNLESEVVKLRKQVESLEATSEESARRARTAEARAEARAMADAETIDEASKALGAEQKMRKVAEGRHEFVQKQYHIMGKYLDDKDKQIAKQAQELAEQKQELAHLGEQLAERKEELDDVTETMTKLAEDKDKMASSHRVFEGNVIQMERKRDATVARLKKELAAAEAAGEKRAGDVAHLQRLRHDEAKAAERADADLRATKARLAAEAQRVAGAAQQRKGDLDTLAAQRGEIAAQRQALANRERDLAAATKERDEGVTERWLLQQRVKGLQAKMAQRVEELEAKMALLGADFVVVGDEEDEE